MCVATVAPAPPMHGAMPIRAPGTWLAPARPWICSTTSAARFKPVAPLPQSTLKIQTAGRLDLWKSLAGRTKTLAVEVWARRATWLPVGV